MNDALTFKGAHSGAALSAIFAISLISSVIAASRADFESGGVDAGAGDDASADAQANNPLADIVSFGIQNYYIGEVTGTGEDANQLWLRYARPLSFGESTWLMRASLPVNAFPSPGGGHETGIGDFNIFAAYLFDSGNPALSIGLGPQITMPTASNSLVGSEKWSAGLSHIVFDGRNPRFQWGYLMTWQHSFAGDSSRNTVNVGAIQPFAFYQLGKGWYLRSAPIWVYNFQNDNYNVPIGLGVGKVIKKGKTVYNFFVEPEFSVANRGAGQSEWQIYFGLNMQFR